MSLWYDVKKKSYAYNAKESWLRSYADKIVSALKTEVLERLSEHFAGSLGRHSAADVNCQSGESVQTALDLEKEERVVGDNNVRSLVAQEEVARKGGDNQIKTLVTQEENSRIAGDNEIKALLAAEEAARASALNLKVDKVSGKTLSTNDYSTADKLKLSGIESGAQVNSVTSVAGKTGAVTLEKRDVGLDNVNNTSDLNKPISNATAKALESKANISDVLTKNNTSAFTPSGSYNPATKKYVDEQVVIAASGGSIDLSSYLLKDNAEAFTPTGDYNPATKKYVDDNSIAKIITSDGGISIGEDSNTNVGISIGLSSFAADYGVAVGTGTYVKDTGGAVGFAAKASSGGAIGTGAATSAGFAGGYFAQTVNANDEYIDAIQLGEGTNSAEKTLQVYNFQLLDANGNIPKGRLKNTIGMTPPTLTAVTANDTSASSDAWTGTGYFCKTSAKYVANPGNNPSIQGYYRFCLRPAAASDKECMQWTPYFTYNGYKHEFFYSPVRGLYEALIPPSSMTAEEIVDKITWEFTPPTILKYGKLSNAINYTLKEDGETMDKISVNSEMYIRDSSGNITAGDGQICMFIVNKLITFADLDTNVCALLHLISDTEAEGKCSINSSIGIGQVAACTASLLPIETIDSFNA